MSICSDNSHTSSSSLLSKTSTDTRSTAGRSQLHWKLYRKDVLARHHIRILDALPGDHLPEPVVSWVNANRNNTVRFIKQRRHFRKQVAKGRGFCDSALFPHEVLPWTKGQPFIAKCMVPTLSSEALPEMKLGGTADKPALPQPKPGLGCGFSTSAFGPEELAALPDFLQATGTAIHFDKASINTGSVLLCPWLTFERTFQQHHCGTEVASNQCAVNGAWCVRSLQMLNARAAGEESEPVCERPVAFSCAIDNTVAIIYHHWIDHAQTYCMAPVVRFELIKDDHFDQLLVWLEAIGHWALNHVLPNIKKAISGLGDYKAGVPALVKTKELVRLDTASIQDEQNLVTALKVSYENIPWRYEHSSGSAVSSSTASWGSPMINEALFSKIKYPLVPQPNTFGRIRSPGSYPVSMKGLAEKQLGLSLRSSQAKRSPPLPMTPPSAIDDAPTPAFEQNCELLMKKRLDHAMDEIRDLQSQLVGLRQEVSGSNSYLQNDVAGLRRTMNSVMRKERLNFRQGAVLKAIETPNILQTEQHVSFEKNVSIITTPTEPAPRPLWARPNAPRRPSALKNVLSLDTNVSASMTTKTTSMINSISSAFPTASTNASSAIPDSGVLPNALPRPCQSPEECSSPGGCKSPITIYSPTIINLNGQQEDYWGDETDTLVRVSSSSPHNLWSTVVISHLISVITPSAMLRIIFLGFVADYCMVIMIGRNVPPVSHYVADVVGTALVP